MYLRSLTKVFLFSLLLVLAGFSARERILPSDAANIDESRTISVNEVSDNTPAVLNYINKGVMKASWYGPRFHGKLTANGEIFDQETLTAAHKSYRFGTLLKITNPAANKSVIVRINDRGPYIAGRELDLSKAAARELGMLHKGVARIKVEEVTLQGVNFPVISFD